MVRQRVRIRFCKQGELRWIGHRDLVRMWERLVRRAGLRLSMSKGFHPKPRMTFPSALAVGIESVDEVMEVELADMEDAETIRNRLAGQAPTGLRVNSVEVLPPEARKARVRRLAYEIAVPPRHQSAAAERIARLWASSSYPIVRPHRRQSVDLRAFVEDLRLAGGRLYFCLDASKPGAPGPRDVLAAVNLTELEHEGARLRRAAVEIT
jgi:radical SAM-linked protein